MIKTLDEFNDAEKFIGKDLDMYDFDLSKQMNSYEYNLYLQDTQFFFDMLYEKIRVLEDMIDYLDKYSNAKIKKVRAQLRQKESILQTAVDQFLDKNFIAISPEWVANPAKNIKDRDGSTIPVANTSERKNNFISNQTIRPGYSITNRAKILNAIKTSSHIALSDNLIDFAKTGEYIVSYELERPAHIIENIVVSFDYIEGAYNSVDYNAINCDIKVSSTEKGKINLELISDYGRKTITPFYFDEYAGRRTDDIVKITDKIECKNIIETENKIIDLDNEKTGEEYYNTVSEKWNTDVTNEKASEIEETKNCWKYTPKEEKTIRDEADDTPYELRATLSHLENNDVRTPDAYNYKATYKMGFNNFSVCRKSFYKTSGILSEPIYLDNFSYITILANEDENTNLGIEYSIVDGVNIVPILPENIEMVYREKLFPNMSTRFPINRHFEITLYEDNEISERNYTNLVPEDFEKHEYSISYKPGNESHKYKPINNDIRIMAVFRRYNENADKNTSVYLRKYGGAVEWN